MPAEANLPESIESLRIHLVGAKGTGMAGAAHAIEPCIVFVFFLIAGPGKHCLKLKAPGWLVMASRKAPQAEPAEE